MMSYFSKYNDPAELSENLLGPILTIYAHGLMRNAQGAGHLGRVRIHFC